MKIIAWIISPVLMLWWWGMKKEDNQGNETGYFLLILVPAVFLQITYWYMLVNFPIVFGAK